MQNIKTGKEKQQAYSKEYKQFIKALKQEFYLEAVSIGYAIIEDRLIAFLHHAGIITRTNNELLVNRAVYPYMRRLMNKDDKYLINIKDLTVKMDLIGKLLDLSAEDAKTIDCSVNAFILTRRRKGCIAKSGYMSDLVDEISKLDHQRVKETFSRIEEWRIDRNQLIHALLNKTVDTAEEKKRSCAENTYSLTRELDNYLVKPFKVNNRIRRKYNIQ